MPDIADQIDAAIGAAPDTQPGLDDTLAAGRRALVRRRLAVGVGATTTALVIGGSAWAVGTGGSPTDANDGGVASEPSSPVRAGESAKYDPTTGELVVGDGWEISERVEDPITGPAPSDLGASAVADSVGLVMTDGVEERWVLAWYAADPTPGDATDGTGKSGTATGKPGEDFDSFRRWLANQSAIMQGEPDGKAWGHDGARLDADGDLETKPGWEVAERIDEPDGPGSLAVEVTNGDQRQWFLWAGETTVVSPRAPEQGYDSFQEWVDVNSPTAGDDDTLGGDNDGAGQNDEWPGVPRDDLVAFTANGSLEAVGGTRILAQEAGIDLGASFAKPADTAVAEVEVDGERWYVVARQNDDPADYIAVPATKGGNTLDEFIEFARTRYAEGGGGLL